MSGLKLCDEQPDVLGDDLLAVCALVAVGRDVTLSVVALLVRLLLMGGSSAFEWLCCVCSQTRLGPGPRQPGRQVQEEGFPTREEER